MSLPPPDRDWELSPTHVAALRDAGELAVLLDVRTPDEVATASIDGSDEIPMQVLSARLEELDAYRSQKVVVFCHGGVRSRHVTEFLRKQGFTDAWSMQGGIDAWSVLVDPTVPRY